MIYLEIFKRILLKNLSLVYPLEGLRILGPILYKKQNNLLIMEPILDFKVPFYRVFQGPKLCLRGYPPRGDSKALKPFL